MTKEQYHKPIFFVDESKPDKKGKLLNEEDKKKWFWGLVNLFSKTPPVTDEEKSVQQMYKRILIFDE